MPGIMQLKLFFYTEVFSKANNPLESLCHVNV